MAQLITRKSKTLTHACPCRLAQQLGVRPDSHLPSHEHSNSSSHVPTHARNNSSNHVPSEACSNWSNPVPTHGRDNPFHHVSTYGRGNSSNHVLPTHECNNSSNHVPPHARTHGTNPPDHSIIGRWFVCLVMDLPSCFVCSCSSSTERVQHLAGVP